MAYDSWKENPGYEMWNVVGVEKRENEWTIRLIGRDKEVYANVWVRKKSLPEELEKGLLSLNSATDQSKPVNVGREDCGYTIVDRNTCYVTEVTEYNASKEYADYTRKHYAGQENNPYCTNVFKELETMRATYEEWKALPQTPLENPVSAMNPIKCYLGLPEIVYMHLVGQVSTVI